MHLKFKLIMLMGLLASFAAYSCFFNGNNTDDDPEIVNMRINHFQQTGIGAFPQLVYLVQEADKVGGEQWEFFYDEIQGFQYEPGYVYDLEISKEELENPPQDASGIKYILENVRSREKVPENETFDIKLKWGGNDFVNRSGAEFSLMDEYLIDCSDLCNELLNKLENEEEVTGTFRHGINNGLKLISIQ